mgnify:FL=1
MPIDPHELAKTICADWNDYFRDLIANKDEAYKLACHLLAMSNRVYTLGGVGHPTEDQYPASIKTFSNKVCEDQDGIKRFKKEYQNGNENWNYHAINADFNAITSAIPNHETKLIINLALVENIIQEWDLNNE